MLSERPYVLSIAGFDPSGGAGILADIKTFEANKTLGMGIISAITFQNDSEFENVKWIDAEEIKKQISILTKKFYFGFVKIGMIQNLDVLSFIASEFQTQNSKLIWDPILKTSSGFEIHKNFEKEKLISVLKKLFLITPNIDEIKILTGEIDEVKGAKELSKYCNVLLKGGHANTERWKSGMVEDVKQIKTGRDYLFTTDGKEFPYRAKRISDFPKHGSGCVLSSAITAQLAKGETLQRACLKGKDYVTKFLFSNKTLIGYHKI
jgi:hydroxymethylpyrimidine/phosphomethylpyrimidine kinase